jgi:hypothetical protein
MNAEDVKAKDDRQHAILQRLLDLIRKMSVTGKASVEFDCRDGGITNTMPSLKWSDR